MKDFPRKQWFNSNDLISTADGGTSYRLRPSVLVVADELFLLGDEELIIPARFALPDRPKVFNQELLGADSYDTIFGQNIF